MSLSDEEQIVATTYDSGTKHETLKRGNIKVTTINKEETGIEESHLSVFLEVTGSGYKNERPGVDIVTVLDVGESMKGEKLETLKGVMRLLIDKFSSADRLSIVTVSKNPQKLCGLRQMSLVSQAEIEKLVSGLETRPGKDVNGSLDMAFKVINDRKYVTGRRVAILLMSDGDQFEVPIKHTFFESMPVYTFGFGDDLINSMVLNDVAKSSDGGIHCSIDVASSCPSNLRSAVAECFAKLFTVVVSDLKLTVKRAKSTAKIDNICVGTYSRSYIPFTALEDNVIVSFGDLYANETCKVEVNLHLPHVTSQQPCDLLHFSYSWRAMEEVFNSSSRLVRVNRVANHIREGGSEQENGETGLRDVDRLSKFQGLSELLKGLWLQLNNISSCIYKLLIPPFLVVLSLLSSRTQDMLKSLTMVWIRFRESIKSEAGGNKVPTKKNDRSQAAPLKGLGSQVIDVSLRMSKYLFPLLIIILILYGMSKQVGIKSPIEREVLQRDVTRVTDLRAYYCNSHVGILSDHLRTALDSVMILRDILSNYMEQHIRLQPHEGQSSDHLVRSRNVKAALGEHIHMTFEWSKAIKKVLHNAETIPLYVKNWEARIIDQNPVKDESNNSRKYLACLVLLLASLVGMRLNKLSVRSLQGCLTHVSTSIKAMAKSLLGSSKKIDPSLTAKLMEDMSNHIQKTLYSVQIIRGILSDYVKQHTEFEDNNNNSKDSVRSRNVKALGDYRHFQLALTL
ncbi:uncharacterized protein LOC141656476 [Silene latifolia]|uniref:uncharacterized protein LOC141656476 n=1 Tax=Silene latifolia TaxID=37657 RepID=UPI003D779890